MNGMAAMLVPNAKEVNAILLLKGEQHGCCPHHCKSRIPNVYMDSKLCDALLRSIGYYIILIKIKDIRSVMLT
jgi:hypothetical protein